MSNTEHIVVLYHYVTDEKGFKGISSELFEQHLKYLKKEGYIPLSSNELVEWLVSGKEIPEKTATIQFDDGLVCQKKIAYPLLRKYNFPATFFMSTGTLENNAVMHVHKVHLLLSQYAERDIGNLFTKITGTPIPEDVRINKLKRWDSNYVANLKYYLHRDGKVLGEIFTKFFNEKEACKKLYFSYEDAIEMIDNGMEIGSHTHNHVFLGNISEEEQFKELSLSKRLIEENVKEVITLLSYPSGSYNEKTPQLAVKAGYKAAFTVETGVNTKKTNPYFINRIDANHITRRINDS